MIACNEGSGVTDIPHDIKTLTTRFQGANLTSQFSLVKIRDRFIK